MKSWKDPDAPRFQRHKSGVTVWTKEVAHFIPWEMWEWIKLAMGDEQQARQIPWNDPAEGDATGVLDDVLYGPKARGQEVEGRHEGVQERDAVRRWTVQSGIIDISRGMDNRPAGSPGVPEARSRASDAEAVPAHRPFLALDSASTSADDVVASYDVPLPSEEDRTCPPYCCIDRCDS